MKHPPFFNTLTSFFGGDFLNTGIRVPTGAGKTAFATRENLAEAHGAILTQSGHENKSYILSGREAVSLKDIAGIISSISGKEVPLISVTDKEYVDAAIANGLPEFVAPFLLDWITGMNRGEWEKVTGDLERLIGHAPTSAEEFFKNVYQASGKF